MSGNGGLGHTEESSRCWQQDRAASICNGRALQHKYCTCRHPTAQKPCKHATRKLKAVYNDEVANINIRLAQACRRGAMQCSVAPPLAVYNRLPDCRWYPRKFAGAPSKRQRAGWCCDHAGQTPSSDVLLLGRWATKPQGPTRGGKRTGNRQALGVGGMACAVRRLGDCFRSSVRKQVPNSCCQQRLRARQLTSTLSAYHRVLNVFDPDIAWK